MQRQITVVPLTSYTVQVIAAQTATIVLGSRVYDVREAVSGVLLARIKTSSWGPPGGSGTIAGVNVLVMPDDPPTTYVPSTNPKFVTINIAPADPTPNLYVAGFSTTSPAGLMAQFQLALTSNNGNGAVTLQLGLDLIIRDA